MGMIMGFSEISPLEIRDNVFKMIGREWMLITAGNESGWNTMTASWGGLGVLWGKNVVHIYVRPVRYTYLFTEKKDTFTCSFFDESWHDALQFCGNNSGRDTDKAAATGLSPVFTPEGVYFEQARLVLACRKIYTHDIDPAAFLDPSIDKNYPKPDYHRMYIGEITKCLLQEPAPVK